MPAARQRTKERAILGRQGARPAQLVLKKRDISEGIEAMNI
jgi:hypothetical protein